MTSAWLVLTRVFHFGSCLLFFGIFAFDRFVAVSLDSSNRSEAAMDWQSRVRLFCLIALAASLFSGIAWFYLITIAMGDLPLGQMPPLETMKLVWRQTEFGTAWQIRSVFWLAAAILAGLLYYFRSRPSFQKGLAWLQLMIGGGLLGGLAWAGHGQEGQPAGLHLFADVLHLLVAGVWPTGLLPLAWLLRSLRPPAAHIRALATLIQRFSAVSLVAVIILAITGWINGWFMVGSLTNLMNQPYGRLLVLKVTLFCIAVAIGAVNLWQLKPRLLKQESDALDSRSPVARLQINVMFELVLGLAILVVVAILGLTPPPQGY